jgi:hypothetical protein
MKITVEFDSEEEFKARIKNPRGSRTADDGDAQPVGQAPAPLQPPQQQPQAFNPMPPAPAAFTPPQGFPGATAGQPAIDPAVVGLVQRINTRIDTLIANGQPSDAILNWLRGQCGAEASAATLDHIKTVFLPKLTQIGLDQIAKLTGA